MQPIDKALVCFGISLAFSVFALVLRIAQLAMMIGGS